MPTTEGLINIFEVDGNAMQIKQEQKKQTVNY